MADVSAHTPIFSRGSTVLAYWLVHAEGLTVQPSGALVEEVVVGAPLGHAEVLIVRSRMTRRRKAIPADSIAAVEPSSGSLLLDEPEGSGPRRLPRPSPELVAAARAGTARASGIARTGVVGAARSTGTAASSAATAMRSAVAWLRPRALRAGAVLARGSRTVAERTAAGSAWLAPRIVSAARGAGTAVARFVVAAGTAAARGLTRAARELEHGSAAAARHGRASLEARRAERRREDD